MIGTTSILSTTKEHLDKTPITGISELAGEPECIALVSRVCPRADCLETANIIVINKYYRKICNIYETFCRHVTIFIIFDPIS